MYKILMTGITGFIGFNLAQRLFKHNCKIYGIVRPSSNVNNIKLHFGDKIGLFGYSCDEDIFDIVSRVKPDIVIHLASAYLPFHKFNDIEDLIDSNIAFGAKLVDAMVQNEVYNFINTGSYSQHYNNEEYNPVNLYAASKQAFMTLLKFYEETTPLKSIHLQLFDTYGYNDPRPKILSLLKRTGETGETLKMSPGEQLIDIVYIDNAVDAFVRAVEILSAGEYDKCGTYAVSSQNPLPLKELVKKFERISGLKISVEWGGRPYRNREVMLPWNNGKILPGWHCKISLEEGIAKFLQK